MAETTVATPIRVRMSLATGAKALLAGGAAEAGGQQSLTLAIIAGGFVLAAAIAGPVATEWVRQRLSKPQVDHPAEFVSEQAELAAMRTIDHLIDEISERDHLLAERDAEIARLKRRGGRA